MNMRNAGWNAAFIAGIMAAWMDSVFAADAPLFVPQARDTMAQARPMNVQQLLPVPQSIRHSEGEWTIKSFPAINADADFKPELPTVREILTEAGFTDSSAAGSACRLIITRAAIADAPERVRREAYRLTVIRGEIRIEAESTAGVFYAAQTLRQLLPAPGGVIQNVVITDWPRFPIRGFMHDVGRNYQTPELLMKQIEIFSRYKYNVFQFHITDNPGWRLESKKYPELAAPPSFSRHTGKIYTQEEFRRIVDFARARHITVIPELDVPGHTAAFRRAFKLQKMNDPRVRTIVSDLIEELCGLVPADIMPMIHLGTDESKTEEKVPVEWVREWIQTGRKHGRQVITWVPGIHHNEKDGVIQQLWTGQSKPAAGIPYIDSQNNFYINHLDPFDLLAAAAYQQPCRFGSDELKLGAIMCVWHDDRVASGDDVILMNAVYPAALLYSDNLWRGRPKDEPDLRARLPARSDPRFALAADLERRLLAHRDRYFAAEPFPYVKQTDLEWRMIGPFDHGGKTQTPFPPETEGIKADYKVAGKPVSWWAESVPGATHYPSHFWYPSHVKASQGTVYAFTRIWSPRAQDVGAWIGFNAWSRSSGRKRGGGTPPNGEWSKMNARVWLNGELLRPPALRQPNVGGEASEEIPLVDEDYFYRAPQKIALREGWNTVLIKAPKGSNWKWVFTFTPVRPTGNGINVREVEGLRYDATIPEGP